MISIHHYSDTEREEKPPANIRRIAHRVADTGGSVLKNARGFVSSAHAIIENVRTTPNDCGSDYWEFVLRTLTYERDGNASMSPLRR
jgi:hypothetical protein